MTCRPGPLWIAALPPITGLTGAAYADPMQFRFSFAQISWIPVPHLACPVAFRHAPGQTRGPNSSQTSNRPRMDHVQDQA